MTGPRFWLICGGYLSALALACWIHRAHITRAIDWLAGDLERRPLAARRRCARAVRRHPAVPLSHVRVVPPAPPALFDQDAVA